MNEVDFDKLSDEQLFDLFKKNNDNKAFASIYSRYSKKVYAYCIRACGDKDVAKDVFQKVFTSIIEKRNSFIEGNFIAWVMVITRNYCLMEKRAKKKTEEIFENTLITEPDNNFDFAEKAEVIKAVNKLPEEYSDIIKLRYFDDFTYNEIADILDISLSLVKVRLFRAKQLLVNLLKPLMEKS